MSNKKRARRFLPYETDYKLLDNYICCFTYGNPRSKGFQGNHISRCLLRYAGNHRGLSGCIGTIY